MGHPCAELPAVALALDAEFLAVAPRSEYRLRARDFYPPARVWRILVDPVQLAR